LGSRGVSDPAEGELAPALEHGSWGELGRLTSLDRAG